MKKKSGAAGSAESVIRKSPITAHEASQLSGNPGQLDDTPFLLLYGGSDDKVRVRVLLHDETISLTQRQMAELFDTTADNISLHRRNIYAEGELAETATTEDFSVVQSEGGRAVRRNRRDSRPR